MKELGVAGVKKVSENFLIYDICNKKEEENRPVSFKGGSRQFADLINPRLFGRTANQITG